MVKHAKSISAKNAETRRAHDDAMATALEDLLAEQQKPEPRRSCRAVARDHGVSHVTLSRLAKGGQTLSEFNASKQKLMPAEECVIIDWLCQSAERGFPQTQEQIETIANKILQARLGENYEPVGVNWGQRFLTRHNDQLQTMWGKPLASERAQSLNPTNLASWYALVEKHIVDEEVDPEMIFGMDESGFPLLDTRTRRVIAPKGTKRQHQQGSGNKENITVITTICADGTTLRPTIIFQGKNFMAKWRDNNVSKASICHSERGWTDSDLGLQWMQKDFEPTTHEKAAGRTRVLLMDGHSSHYTPELLRYAQAHKITILGYPPHCTHALQGLDVVCFAAIKDVYGDKIKEFEDKYKRAFSKMDFTGVFGDAFLSAFTPRTIKAAFEKTGVYPFNPGVITASQLKPSEATSTSGSVPVTQPSPVRAILEAFRKQPPTSFDVAADTHALPVITSHSPAHDLPPAQIDFALDPALDAETPLMPDALARVTAIPDIIVTLPPTTPASSASKRLERPVECDSPSKRIRLVTANLAQTSSGSFLVSKPKMTAANRIIPPVLRRSPAELLEPDWTLLDGGEQEDHSYEALLAMTKALTINLRLARMHIDARDEIIATGNAQMILQSLYTDKLHQALYEKEKKKGKEDRMILNVGGTHLTDEEFIQELERRKQAKADEENARRARKQSREERRLEKETLDAAWKRLLAGHEIAVKRWEVARDELVQSGARKKDLPPKPKRPRKPKPAREEGAEESSSDDDHDDA